MTGACSLSTEKLVGLEEGLFRVPIEISVKKKKKSICKQLIQYGSLVLCIELIVLGHWALYNLWENYDTWIPDPKLTREPQSFPIDSPTHYEEIQQEEPNYRDLENTLNNFEDPGISKSELERNEAYLRDEPLPAPIPKEIPRIVEHEQRDFGENIDDFDPECLINIIGLSADEEKIDELRKKYESSMEERRPWRMRHYLGCVMRNSALRDKTIFIDDKSGRSHLCIFKEVSSVPVLECVKTVKTGGLTDPADGIIRNGGEEEEDRNSNSKSFENLSHSGESGISAEPFPRTIPGNSPESAVAFVYPTEDTTSEEEKKIDFDSQSNSPSSEVDASGVEGWLGDRDHLTLENLIQEIYEQQIGHWSDESKEEQSLDSPVIIDPFEIAQRFIRSAKQSDSLDDSKNPEEIAVEPEGDRVGVANELLNNDFMDFFQRMEILSAHIDRLHQYFLQTNELNDDYLSQELLES